MTQNDDITVHIHVQYHCYELHSFDHDCWNNMVYNVCVNHGEHM